MPEGNFISGVGPVVQVPRRGRLIRSISSTPSCCRGAGRRRYPLTDPAESRPRHRGGGGPFTSRSPRRRLTDSVVPRRILGSTGSWCSNSSIMNCALHREQRFSESRSPQRARAGRRRPGAADVLVRPTAPAPNAVRSGHPQGGRPGADGGADPDRTLAQVRWRGQRPHRGATR